MGGHDVGDGRQLLGGGRCCGEEAGDGLGGGGQHQQAAHELVDRVQPELEAGGDAEVAAAAADGPEQLRMGLVVDAEQVAVGGGQLGGQQVVDGQAVPSDQQPDAAAQGEPADPDRGGVAEPGGQPVGAGGDGVGAGGQPVWARAVRCWGSISRACMSARSIRIPPSVVLCPARLWPPLRTASSSPSRGRSRPPGRRRLCRWAGRSPPAGGRCHRRRRCGPARRRRRRARSPAH